VALVLLPNRDTAKEKSCANAEINVFFRRIICVSHFGLMIIIMMIMALLYAHLLRERQPKWQLCVAMGVEEPPQRLVTFVAKSS